jgi:adenine specific DNA methylase Mod
MSIIWNISLAKNESIYVQIDNNQSHYLKVIMDEIFVRNSFVQEGTY